MRWQTPLMSRRTGVEIVTIIFGVFLMGIGTFLIAFPREMTVFHHADEGAPYVEPVSRAGSRVYGVLGVVLGIALVAAACRPGKGVKGRTIERFVWRLPQALVRRFGSKKYYTVDEVTRTARDAGYDMAFIAHAHALFCTREGFDEYYEPLRVCCTYDGLREQVSKRYFGGVRDFDAADLVIASKEPYSEENVFHEGGLA